MRPHPSSVLACFLLVLASALALPAWSAEPDQATPEKAEPPKAAPAKQAEYPLWDGKESVADYARKAGLDPTLSLELLANVKLNLVLIPAGRFTMGSPRDEAGREYDEVPHEVTITRPFYMGKTEVTQQQYEAITDHNPANKLEKAPQRPACSVSWEEAVLFCLKLGQKVKREVRLPTEAEWEFACRAGTQTPYYAGATPDVLDKIAWFRDNARLGSKTEGTHAAGQKQPNAFGLHDMLGNVYEWCQDTYEEYPRAAVADPKGPPQGYGRVARGGAWLKDAAHCRAGNREWFRTGDRFGHLGLRVVVNVAAKP